LVHDVSDSDEFSARQRGRALGGDDNGNVGNGYHLQQNIALQQADATARSPCLRQRIKRRLAMCTFKAAGVFRQPLSLEACHVTTRSWSA
jgi:hypothetical protein